MKFIQTVGYIITGLIGLIIELPICGYLIQCAENPVYKVLIYIGLLAINLVFGYLSMNFWGYVVYRIKNKFK